MNILDNEHAWKRNPSTGKMQKTSNEAWKPYLRYINTILG